MKRLQDKFILMLCWLKEFQRSKSYLNKKKRKAKIQEAAQCYTEEDWDTIKAKIKANAELTKSLQGESVTDDDFVKRMMEMINKKKSEIGIDAIPTAIKPPSIVDWKIIPQTGQKVVYEIIRSDGSYKVYMSLGAILKYFSRDDLTELYRLVIKKYGANRPEEMYDRVLWGDLKTMFDPPLMHCLTLEASTIYMLADRKYPLSKDACQVMLKMRLLDGTMDEVQDLFSKGSNSYEGLKKYYDLDKTIFFTYGKVYSLKRSPKDKDKDEDPSTGSNRGLKKKKTSKDASPATEEPEFEVAESDMPQDQEENLGKNDKEPKKKVASKRNWFTKPTQPQEPTNPNWNVDKTLQQGQNQSWLMTLASSAKKWSKTFDELMITPIDFSAFIMNGLKINNLTQETLLGPAFRLLKGTHFNFAELEYDFEECYKALSEKLDWENPESGDYPFDLTKPLPLVMTRNRQKVPVDYFFNNDLKYLQGGISTMTYTTSLKKTKVAQYDLPSIKDMVLNIWVPVKVAYDKHVLWGISHWREQHKTFYGYARGLQSTHDVYSTKCILAVTQVEVMRKHRYGYRKEIIVRRADNDLYRFKEGDFPHLHINDIKYMLLLVVQNWLTNLSGDDISDFVIALRMFTRSLVIQKRVKNLQLIVETYQKKINVTMPETNKSGIRKRDPYTP
ncbi:hypothetical protein Tco_0823633 [Tanacetum coccineum]|uniref:Uncharacterized protein n=1 Tax=Tanacetum coccineum TaxID=301880 RepID=A0ABQ5AK89_9ASTR